MTVLTRQLVEVRERANRRVWRLLTQTLTLEHRRHLDKLLIVADGERTTQFEQLRRAPLSPSGPGLVQGLERIATIRSLPIPRIAATHIPPSRLTTLARFATTARAQAIARLQPARRMATLLAFIHLLEATAHDDVLDIFDAFFTALFADATNAGVKERVRTLKDLDAAALQLATIGAMILDPTVTDVELRAAVLTIFSPHEIAVVLERVADVAQPPDDTYYDELQARYRRVSRVRPTLLRTLRFECLPAAQPLVDAYTFLFAAAGPWILFNAVSHTAGEELWAVSLMSTPNTPSRTYMPVVQQ